MNPITPPTTSPINEPLPLVASLAVLLPESKNSKLATYIQVY